MSSDDASSELDLGTAAIVRPYAWTRGRTTSRRTLAVEALVSMSVRGRQSVGLLQLEHKRVAELCAQPRSVAEIAALLSIPLGVARVLVGDMVDSGTVVVHTTAADYTSGPDVAMLERVLSGLQRL